MVRAIASARSVRTAAGASVPLRRLLSLALGPRVRAAPALGREAAAGDTRPHGL